jgi:hypothetical protein
MGNTDDEVRKKISELGFRERVRQLGWLNIALIVGLVAVILGGIV